MRRWPTEAEAVLWQELRAGQLDVRFRRQHVLGYYIADFACLSHLLIVEVDGPVHDDPEARTADRLRTETLEAAGSLVLRFSNENVLHRLSGVCTAIREALSTRPLDRRE